MQLQPQFNMRAENRVVTPKVGSAPKIDINEGPQDIDNQNSN